MRGALPGRAAIQTLQGVPPANTPPVRVTALPGTQFRYSGSHFAVLQQLLVDVTGQPFAALLRELLFAPLGMRDSGYEIDFPVQHSGATASGATASGHDAGGESIADDWRALPESAGAGLWTTPTDLCRLSCEIMAAWSEGAGRLLDRDTARRMLTPQIGGWGLGWTVETIDGALRFGHSGSNIGYQCRVVAWPERGVGAAVMTNADDGGFLVGEILAAIGREYGWPDAAGAGKWADYPRAPVALAACAGVYGGSAGQPRLTVAVIGNDLTLMVQGQSPVALRAIGAATFIADVVNTEVIFAPGDAGGVHGLTLRQYGESLMLDRVG